MRMKMEAKFKVDDKVKIIASTDTVGCLHGVKGVIVGIEFIHRKFLCKVMINETSEVSAFWEDELENVAYQKFKYGQYLYVTDPDSFLMSRIVKYIGEGDKSNSHKVKSDTQGTIELDERYIIPIEQYLYHDIFFAFKNGAKIEFSHDNVNWCDINNPIWSIDVFYRVVKKKTYKVAFYNPFLNEEQISTLYFESLEEFWKTHPQYKNAILLPWTEKKE